MAKAKTPKIDAEIEQFSFNPVKVEEFKTNNASLITTTTIDAIKSQYVQDYNACEFNYEKIVALKATYVSEYSKFKCGDTIKIAVSTIVIGEIDVRFDGVFMYRGSPIIEGIVRPWFEVIVATTPITLITDAVAE